MDFHTDSHRARIEKTFLRHKAFLTKGSAIGNEYDFVKFYPMSYENWLTLVCLSADTTRLTVYENEDWGMLSVRTDDSMLWGAWNCLQSGLHHSWIRLP
jgi:hypothetical protein